MSKSNPKKVSKEKKGNSLMKDSIPSKNMKSNRRKSSKKDSVDTSTELSIIGESLFNDDAKYAHYLQQTLKYGLYPRTITDYRNRIEVMWNHWENSEDCQEMEYYEKVTVEVT